MILDRGEVGNDAGWHLRFYTDWDHPERGILSFGAGDYYAAVEASLPSGLEGGTYLCAVEGITGPHYRVLHQAWNTRAPLYVDLYLYWRDSGGATGYLASLAGLGDTLDSLAGTPPDDARVARLQVTRLSRRVGARRFEALIEARERVYEALRKRPATPPEPAADAVAAAGRVARTLGVDFVPHGGDAAASAPPVELGAHRSGLDMLADLEGAMVWQAKKGGRGMYLIRDGALHIGPERELAPTIALDERGGLAHVETGAIAGNERAGGDAAVQARVQYRLTLKGRPDLRPGHVVGFVDPFTDAAGNALDPEAGLDATTTPSSLGDALAGLGQALFGGAVVDGSHVEAYVSGVSHRLSRSEGFVTTVTAVGRKTGQGWWDPVSAKDGRSDADPAATTHADFAIAVERMARRRRVAPAVAEVRAANVQGQDEPPAQTVDVWAGLVDGDGAPRAARRLAIDRDAKARLSGVPYATPFAWGKCGLVLPRYPGTRVLLAHAGDDRGDPVDVGALWESGQGPESQAGDYWLILPVAVDGAKRRAIDDDAPAPAAQKASNDLIDADGARVIEVGRLTIRVTSQLGAPGTRPAGPSDSADELRIEHESGSCIVMKHNGDVVISAKGTLTLDADQVDVKVAKTMDVGDR